MGLGITDIGASALGQALSQSAGLGLRELDMRGNKAGRFSDVPGILIIITTVIIRIMYKQLTTNDSAPCIRLESMEASVNPSELNNDAQCRDVCSES